MPLRLEEPALILRNDQKRSGPFRRAPRPERHLTRGGGLLPGPPVLLGTQERSSPPAFFAE